MVNFSSLAPPGGEKKIIFNFRCYQTFIKAFNDFYPRYFKIITFNGFFVSGDGGNEMGMGLVHEEVLCSITNGDQIAAAAPTMWLLSCGVSNWGCWALQFGLAILNDDPVHQRYVAKVTHFIL